MNETTLDDVLFGQDPAWLTRMEAGMNVLASETEQPEPDVGILDEVDRMVNDDFPSPFTD